MSLTKRFIRWCVANDYIKVQPKSKTAEEAEASYNDAITKLRAITELSALVERMSNQIKLAEAKGDIVKSHTLRKKLIDRIKKAKKEGLL
jgi:hypothetical protein